MRDEEVIRYGIAEMYGVVVFDRNTATAIATVPVEHYEDALMEDDVLRGTLWRIDRIVEGGKRWLPGYRWFRRVPVLEIHLTMAPKEDNNV